MHKAHHYIRIKSERPAALKTHMNKIQRIQNEFLHLILNKPYDICFKQRYVIANILIMRLMKDNSIQILLLWFQSDKNGAKEDY